MKRDTREALEKVGWQAVIEMYPTTAMNFARAVNMQPSGPQAKGDKQKIEDVEDAINTLKKAMAQLSDHSIRSIDWFAEQDPEYLDSEERHLWVWDTFVSCQRIVPALSETRERYEKIILKSGPGSISPLTGETRKTRSPVADDNLYKLTYALAEVYLLGLRKWPLVKGQDASSKKPNSLFAKTLEQIITFEGHRLPSPNTIINMSTAAKRRLTRSKIKQVLSENRRTRLRRDSWFSFCTLQGQERVTRDWGVDEAILWKQVTEDF